MNETTKPQASNSVAGRFKPFVIRLFPKTIRRLQMLDEVKTTAQINYRNYQAIRGTNQGNGGRLAKKNFEENARFFNANKYWWMRRMHESIDV